MVETGIYELESVNLTPEFNHIIALICLIEEWGSIDTAYNYSGAQQEKYFH